MPGNVLLKANTTGNMVYQLLGYVRVISSVISYQGIDMRKMQGDLFGALHIRTVLNLFSSKL
jgi:hypothetical protein